MVLKAIMGGSYCDNGNNGSCVDGDCIKEGLNNPSISTSMSEPVIIENQTVNNLQNLDELRSSEGKWKTSNLFLPQNLFMLFCDYVIMA